MESFLGYQNKKKKSGNPMVFTQKQELGPAGQLKTTKKKANKIL